MCPHVGGLAVEKRLENLPRFPYIQPRTADVGDHARRVMAELGLTATISNQCARHPHMGVSNVVRFGAVVTGVTGHMLVISPPYVGFGVDFGAIEHK